MSSVPLARVQAAETGKLNATDQKRNLSEVIAYLQKVDGTVLTVVGKKAA